MFEPKFIDSIITGSMHANALLLTIEKCKFMLNDIATCSVMRLDAKSMEKLWHLMLGICKWQLFVARHEYHLLDISMRHLDGVSMLYSDEHQSQLIDATKNTMLDFWNACTENQQLAIYETMKAWMQNFDTKIAVLIRLGFQTAEDGTYCKDVDKIYTNEFVNTIGANIYEKSSKIFASAQTKTSMMDHFVTMLKVQQMSTDYEDLKPIDAIDVQKRFEWSLQQCEIPFREVDEDIDWCEQQQKSTSNCTIGLPVVPQAIGSSSMESGESSQRRRRQLRLDNSISSPQSINAFRNEDVHHDVHNELMKFYGNMK